MHAQQQHLHAQQMQVDQEGGQVAKPGNYEGQHKAGSAFQYGSSSSSAAYPQGHGQYGGQMGASIITEVSMYRSTTTSCIGTPMHAHHSR